VGKNPVVQLFLSGPDSSMVPVASQKLAAKRKKNVLQLKIEAQKETYSFPYAEKPGRWKILKDTVDGKLLSTKVAGGFVGSMYALYATSLGTPSTNRAVFDWFEYQGNDEIYK
jgi:alpha-N-arabinofuranosidase